MKLQMKLLLGLAVLSLGLMPGMAGAVSYQPDYQPDHPPKGSKQEPQGKAYGYWCKKQGFSKKHVKGQKGTPFSQCVKALAQADKHDQMTAKKACRALKGERHKPHGEKGTAFSRCIKAAAQMRKDEAATVAASSVA
jgi:hypothetical protein